MNIRHLPLPCLPGFRPPGIGTGCTAATIPEATRGRPLPGQHRRKVGSGHMNITQMLEVLIPMLVMLVTFVGLALRVQTNLRRTLEESIEKFSNQVGKDREKDLAKAIANREEDRKTLQDFRTEVLNSFETTHRKIDANTAAIAANTTAIAVNAAETNGNIALNTTKIDAIAANTTAIAANAATHDRNIRKVGDQVAGFKERVSRVEGYIEATSSRPRSVTTSR